MSASDQEPGSGTEPIADAPTDIPTTPAVETPPPPPPVTPAVPKPPRDLRVPALVAAAVFFVLFVLAGPLGVWPSKLQLGGSSPSEARTEIERVSARFGRNLITFSYKTLDRDLARVRKDTTGNFANEFDQAMGGQINFAKELRKSKGVSTGTVKGTIIASQSKDNAVVIVYLTQAVSNKTNPNPRALPRFVQLTLVQSGGSWKVDDVKQLQLTG